MGTIRTEIEKIEKLEAKLIDEEGPDSESLQVLYQRLEELEAADAEVFLLIIILAKSSKAASWFGI